MKEIIRKGNPKSNEPHIFRCRFCSTIFKTDEYEVKPDYHNGTLYVSVCPVCNKEMAYEE
jgi:hypothetical protein